MSMLKQIAEEEQKLEMTPMIDVTFLLLIFFMCTIKFKTLEGKLSAYLPKDVGVNTSEAEPKEKVEISVVLLSEGAKVHPKTGAPWDGSSPRFEYKGRQVEYRVGPQKFADLTKVRQRLEKLFQADEERPATIDARPGTVYSDVVQVLDATIQAGFTDITFTGSYQK